MSISDAQYTAWLKQQDAQRVTLIKLTYSAGTEYVSRGGYVSHPADTPANTIFADCVTGLPSFNSGVADVVSLSMSLSIGDLSIDNANGERDAWLNRKWNGRAIEIYFGDPSWAFSDFRQISSGIIAELRADGLNTLAFVIRGMEYELQQIITTNYSSGPPDGRVIPLCFGECKQVPCVVTNTTTHEYQVHDGAIQAIDAVYENGASVSFTADLANGKFTLTSAPTGTITADIQGAKFSGVYKSGLTELITAMVGEYSSITATITPTDTTTVGFFTNTETDAMSIIQALAQSLGYVPVFTRAGVFDLVRIVEPEALSVDHTLTLDDLKDNGVRIETRYLPKHRWTVNHTYYPQTQDAGSIAGSVAEDTRQELGRAWRKEIYEKASVLTDDLLAGTGEHNAYIVSSTAAATEAQRRVELFERQTGGQVRTLYSIDCFDAPQEYTVGDVISLDYTRLQMDGRNGLIVGMTETIGRVGVMLRVLI